MIAEECKKLRQQLEKVAGAERREAIVEQLKHRQVDLLELEEKVLAVTYALAAMATRTTIEGKLDSTKAHDRVQKIRETLQEDPQRISQGANLTNMKKAFVKFSEEAGVVLEATWDQYKPRAKPTVDANQIAQAEQQEAFRSKVIQLRTRVKYADQISKKPPATEEAFVDLENVWEYIRQTIAELPAVASDPKVQEFLKAANSKDGASLELLTDEVREWLEDNSVADKYCIVSM